MNYYVRMRLSYTQFGALYTISKNNSELAGVLGYLVRPKMLPKTFLDINMIELIDDEVVTSYDSPYVPDGIAYRFSV